MELKSVQKVREGCPHCGGKFVYKSNLVDDNYIYQCNNCYREYQILDGPVVIKELK